MMGRITRRTCTIKDDTNNLSKKNNATKLEQSKTSAKNIRTKYYQQINDTANKNRSKISALVNTRSNKQRALIKDKDVAKLNAEKQEVKKTLKKKSVALIVTETKQNPSTMPEKLKVSARTISNKNQSQQINDTANKDTSKISASINTRSNKQRAPIKDKDVAKINEEKQEEKKTLNKKSVPVTISETKQNSSNIQEKSKASAKSISNKNQSQQINDTVNKDTSKISASINTRSNKRKAPIKDKDVAKTNVEKQEAKKALNEKSVAVISETKDNTTIIQRESSTQSDLKDLRVIVERRNISELQSMVSKEAEGTPIKTPVISKKTPIYKKILKISNVTSSRRVTRQIDHLYDLDLSNEPRKAFKKTRDGFKLKKTVTYKPKKQKQQPLIKPIQPQTNRKLVDVVNKIKQNIANKAKVRKDVEMELPVTKEVHLNNSEKHLTPNKEYNKNMEIDNTEEFDQNEQMDADVYTEPEADDLLDNDDNCSDFWPVISTPLPDRLRRKLAEPDNLGSPINKNISLNDKTAQNSPWRITGFENNRLPVNFPVKSLLLPTYQKDTSLRFSTLDSESLKENEAAKAKLTNEPIKLFEDDFITHNSYVQKTSNIFKTPSRALEATSGESLENRYDHSDNERTVDENSNQNNELSNKSIENSNNEDKENRLDSMFGFDSIIKDTNVLKERNQNEHKATRVSLREIKNIIYYTKKRKSFVDEENLNSNTLKPFQPPAQEKQIEAVIEEPCTLEQPLPLSSSENFPEPVLFEDPENNYDIPLEPNQDFQCYDSKTNNKKSKFIRMFEAKSPKKKNAPKLSTEEWVASKKWEREFNAMVDEVESFEMIIES